MAKERSSSWDQWLRAHPYQVLMESGVREGDTVFDFGCGSGTYAIPAAKIVSDDGYVHALDKNRSALCEISRKAEIEKLKNLRIVHSSDLRTDLDEGSVDIVLLFDVLHEVDNKDALLGEVRRVLKPGGVASVYPMHLRKEDVVRQMAQSKLQLVNEKYDGNILVFRKGNEQNQGDLD